MTGTLSQTALGTFPIFQFLDVLLETCTLLYNERCLSSWFKMIDELIVCLTIESQRCGSRRFDRYTAGLHQAMVSTDCVTV